MSPSRPLCPSEQKRFMCMEEVAIVESLVSNLAEIVQSENDSYKDTICQPRSLANLILQLQMFMDQTLGEKAPHESRYMTKIPAACFRDFAHPNGALKHILSWSLEYRQLHQPEGRRFELLTDKNRQFAIGLCQFLNQRLKTEGLCQPPKVYFWEDSNRQKFNNLELLKQIVLRHEGQVVSSISEATHVVLPESVIDPNDPEHYFRTLEHRGNRLFAHWWYFPDSFDTWIPVTSGTDTTIEPTIIPPDGKWKLSVDWVRLLDHFNEWLNEGDFEIHDLPESLIEACGGIPDYNNQINEVKNENTKNNRPRRGRPRLSDVKAEPPSSTAAFRVRLGSGGAGTRGQIDEGIHQTDESQRRKRGRASLNGQQGHTLTSIESDDKMFEFSSERKRSKVSRDHDQGVLPGTYVLHLIAPGSVRGSYDTVRECQITSASKGLRIKRQKISDDKSAGQMSDIDSDSEENAKFFLSKIRHRRLGEVDTRMFPSTPSAISRSIKKKKSLGRVSSGASPQPTDPTVHVNHSARSFLLSHEEPVAAKPKLIAPGATKYPPRSLQHSIITASKDSFSSIRNLCPIDVDSIATAARHIGSHLARAEVASRAMMALWSASLHLENSTYNHITPLESNEPSDVPPITETESGVHEHPVWFTSSNQRLSDFERAALEHQQSKALSQEIDTITGNGNELRTSQGIPPVLPSQTAIWFDIDNVHPIEREHLQTLFFGCDNDIEQYEQQYKYIRNKIIQRYRVNPRRFLSLTDCRKFIDGDVSLLLRIHSFLDFWGLINFQALPQTFPTRTRRAREFRLPLSSPSWLQSQLSSTAPPKLPKGVVQCIVCQKICLYCYFMLKPGHVAGVSIGLIHRGVWCVRCFANGKFPETLSQRQFMKVTIPFAGTHTGEPNEWNENEVHKLIEGIELYGENWDSVASHVGTRTSMECVTQFIRLPIEDPLCRVEKSEVQNGIKVEERSGTPTFSSSTNPFKDSGNPVMNQINFIHSVLGHECAALSSQAAVESLLEKFSQLRDEQQHDVNMVDGSKSGEVRRSNNVDANGRLDQPLSHEEIDAATQRAVEMAAKFAASKAQEEDQKIRCLMRRLNDLKEQQIEQKIREFYRNEKLIEKTNEEIGNKLEQYFRVRDELWQKLTTASEEGQTVFNLYQKERQEQAQLQQQMMQQAFQAQMAAHQQQQQQPLLQQTLVMPTPIPTTQHSYPVATRPQFIHLS